MKRRSFLRLGAAGMAAAAGSIGAADLGRLKVGAITDEISDDVEVALRFLQRYGLRWVEIRKVWGEQFITEADDATVRKVRALLEKYGMACGVLASAFLKTTLPGTRPVPIEPKQWKDVPFTYREQPALLERSLARARELGAPYVRIFSFWRVPEPNAIGARIAEELAKAAEIAAARKLKLVLENEHTCNVATGEETARMLKLVDHPALGVNWDAGNAFAAGERAFPDGFNHIPKKRLWHTHVKDAVRRPGAKKHRWVPIGKGQIGYPAYLRALVASGYNGMISLETHYEHPTKNKELASKESLEGLLAILKEL